MYKYSILSFDFNNYEILHEVKNPLKDIEYIYVTNNKNLKSNTWKIVQFDKFNNPIESLMYVKYHPFEFVSCDVCCVMDGSTQILGDFSFLYDKFEENHYDIITKQHPGNRHLFDELDAWVKYRKYSRENAEKYKQLISVNLSVDNVFEINVYFVRNDKNGNEFLTKLYWYLTHAKWNEPVCRMDQVMFTWMVLDNLKLKYWLFDKSLENCDKYWWKCNHSSNIPYKLSNYIKAKL